MKTSAAMQEPVARDVNAPGGKVVVAGTIGTVVVSLENLIKDAYEARSVPAPPTAQLRSIADLLTYLSPVVGGRRVLWVDDHPRWNINERLALVRVGIDVQASRSTEEAKLELTEALADAPHHSDTDFDVIITDWNRGDVDHTPDEGLRLVREIRREGISLPVIFYMGVQGAAEMARRCEETRELEGVVGLTSDPSQLMGMVTSALIGRAFETIPAPRAKR